MEIVNKMDLFDGDLDAITSEVHSLNPHAGILTATHVKLSTSLPTVA